MLEFDDRWEVALPGTIAAIMRAVRTVEGVRKIVLSEDVHAKQIRLSVLSSTRYPNDAHRSALMIKAQEMLTVGVAVVLEIVRTDEEYDAACVRMALDPQFEGRVWCD